MVKRRLFGPALALLVALTPSCLGGQTGQPDSGASCPPRALQVGETWQGKTAQELADAFAGKHAAALQWVEEQSGAQGTTPVAFDDGVSVLISAVGAAGTLVSCGGGLDIVVQVDVATTESGLSDAGIGVLSFTQVAPVLKAELSFDGTKLVLDAQLTQTDAAVAPQGWVVPQVAGAPGGSAKLR